MTILSTTLRAIALLAGKTRSQVFHLSRQDEIRSDHARQIKFGEFLASIGDKHSKNQSIRLCQVPLRVYNPRRLGLRQPAAVRRLDTPATQIREAAKELTQ
jgi:hypothetical protein